MSTLPDYESLFVAILAAAWLDQIRKKRAGYPTRPGDGERSNSLTDVVPVAQETGEGGGDRSLMLQG